MSELVFVLGFGSSLPVWFVEMLLRIKPEAVEVVASKEQQDIDDVFGSLVEGLQEDPKIEEAKKSAKVDKRSNGAMIIRQRDEVDGCLVTHPTTPGYPP